jgi:hypothetical protein
MHSSPTHQQALCQNSLNFLQKLTGVSSISLLQKFLSFSVMLGLAMTWAGEAIAQSSPAPTPEPQASPAQASPAQPAPPELTQALTQIDAAASEGDLDAVMDYYSRNLRHSDGLTYQTLRNALNAFWERYPDLTYQTQLNSWRSEGDAIIAETTTTITGVQQNGGRRLNLESTLTSRQRFQNGEIVQQEILDERTEVTTGANPPTVEVNLPEQVTTGQEFAFDAIVSEPLGDRLLLGAALEEPIRPRGYLRSAPIDLEALSAGGLFKVGQAPAQPTNRWISAVLIRDDGISIVTERLQVTRPNGSNPQQ